MIIIHKLKKILLHKCHTESTVAALNLMDNLMQQGSLPRFLSAESATTATAQMRHRAAQVRRHAAWCGVARNAAFRKNVQAFVALSDLFSYPADLPHMPRC
jgi:hypothetical protein